MNDLVDSLKDKKCPNCGASGQIQIMLSESRFFCASCKDKHIDPFEIGPWDENEILLDTKSGQRVSLYVVEEAEAEERDMLQNWAEFFREYYKDAANRVVTNR